MIVATGQAVDARWTASSDDGMIALRAFDVLSSHPPLVGQYSQTSPLIDHAAYSLGPMLYWLLAIPARLGSTALVLTMGLVNALSIMGAVALSARRGGLALAVGCAVATLLMYRSLPAEVPYEIWNCWAGIYPFMLLIFLGWSVACGEYRLLPLLAVVASFVVQVHFVYLLPALAVVAAALAGLALWLRARERPETRRWAIAGVLVALVCWSAPLADQLTHRPGNFVLAARLATDDHPTVETSVAWRATARAIGVVPGWAKRARTPFERFTEPNAALPLATALTAGFVLVSLVGALAAAWRRRRLDLAAAATIALLLCLSMVVVVTSVPAGKLEIAGLTYSLVWLLPAGMFVWLTLAWTAWELSGVLRRALGRIRDRAGPVPALGSLAIVAVAAAVVTDRSDEDPNGRLPPGLKDYALIRGVTARVTDALDGSPGVRIRVPLTVRNSLTFQSAILFALRRDGVPVSVPHRLVKEAGSHYRVGQTRPRDVLVIGDANTSIPPGGELLVRMPEVTIVRIPG